MPGLRVLVTRPRAQAGAWVRRLQAAGWEAAALPLIDIAPPVHAEPVQAAWSSLPGLGMVVFVSPSAVSHFFAQAPVGWSWPAVTAAAAPGPGTLDAVRAQGVPDAALLGPDPGASQFDSEALWARLGGRDWRDRRVLIVRGADEGDDDPESSGQGRHWLGEQLQAAGAQVQHLAAYRRAAPVWTADEAATLHEALAHPGVHVWLLTSSQGIGFLSQLLGGPLPHGRHAAVVTHPRIGDSAQRAGFDRVEAAAPDLGSICAALRRLQLGAG